MVGHPGHPGMHLGAPQGLGVHPSPVAARTSGGPPRKMVPRCRTITTSSLMAGMYAPPAVHDPMTTATCGMPRADIWA